MPGVPESVRGVSPAVVPMLDPASRCHGSEVFFQESIWPEKAELWAHLLASVSSLLWPLWPRHRGQSILFALLAVPRWDPSLPVGTCPGLVVEGRVLSLLKEVASSLVLSSDPCLVRIRRCSVG